MRISKASDGLLPALYAAASGEGEWETFLALLAKHTHSSKCHITYGNNITRAEHLSPEKATRQWIKSVGISDELLAYAGTPGNADEWWRACVYGPYAEGWVGRGSELWPVEKMVRSEIYQTVCLKYDFVWLAVAILFKGPTEMAVCALGRGRKDSDYESDVIDLLSELVPHLQSAIRLYNRVGALQQNLDSLELALEQFAVGVLVLDKTSIIIFANLIARQLLTSEEGLVLKDGKLMTTSARHLKQLQLSIEQAIQISESALVGNRTDRFIGVTSIGNQNGPTLHAFIAPWLSKRQLALNKPAAVMLVTRPGQRIPQDTWLQTLYGLTRAEASLAISIAGGMDGPEAAKHLGLSAETVRTRLKTIFGKTNTRRQADLARLLSTLPNG